MGPVLCCFEHVTPETRESAYKLDDNVQAEDEPPKTYSWDTRGKLDPKQFMFDGTENMTCIKTSGQINGQQFIIQNCKDSSLFLFDHSASVTVDDCTNCTIFIGPCKGSVFVRDCTDCTVALSCQQFRTRDCNNMTVFMHCPTQPIIESSKNMKFACLQLHYENLNNAGLSPFNNQWSNIHDFTPDPGNFQFLPEETQIEDYLKFERVDLDEMPHVSTKVEFSSIPLSLGSRQKPTNEIGFCICFCMDSDVNTQREKCVQLVREYGKIADCRLINSKEVTVSVDDLHKIMESKRFDSMVSKGPIIGLELCGPDALSRLQSVARDRGWQNCIHVSDTSQTAQKELRKFTSFAESLMGV